jgi:uncharacterized membrane protein (UPF0127 family)
MGRGLSRVVVKTPSNAVICADCEVADRAVPRMKGLLGRDGLESGTGMLIKPAPSVHMFFMRFAIDVVFLDKNRRIVGLAHTLRPWRVAGARKAVAALELPAGTAQKHGLELGDVLTFEPA